MMRSLPGALRSEFVKLRSTWLFYGITAGALVLTGLQAWSYAWGYRRLRQAGFRQNVHISAGAFVRDPALSAFLFVLALGVIVMTGEFRHRTTDSTFLAVPSRLAVVASKAIVVLAAGVVMGVLCEIVLFAVGTPLLAHYGVHLNLDGDTWVNLLAVVTMIGLIGALGVGVGAITRNQVGAVVGSLAWLLIAEQVIGGISRPVYQFLLSGLLASVAGEKGTDILSRPVGFLLLVVYVAGIGAAGAAALRRLDIS